MNTATHNIQALPSSSKKKNNDLRLVINYQTINKYIRDDPYTLPKIDECIMDMGTNNFFSQLDLQNGFDQIKINKEARKLTAFMLFGQQYQYKRLPFGLKLGPKTFQRYISEILCDIPNCFVYIDDIIIYTKTKEEHRNVLERVLRKLLEYEVRINFDKSKIGVNEVIVLGYKVNAEGIFPIFTDKTGKLLRREIKTKRDVQRLIGLLNWYRKFIPNLSQRINTLTDLLKKGVNIKRSIVATQMRATIEDIEKTLTNNAKISFPDYSKKFTLQCDASDIGIGSVLTQENKIIGHYSKKLQGGKLNYSIVERSIFQYCQACYTFKELFKGTLWRFIRIAKIARMKRKK